MLGLLMIRTMTVWPSVTCSFDVSPYPSVALYLYSIDLIKGQPDRQTDWLTKVVESNRGAVFGPWQRPNGCIACQICSGPSVNNKREPCGWSRAQSLSQRVICGRLRVGNRTISSRSVHWGGAVMASGIFMCAVATCNGMHPNIAHWWQVWAVVVETTQLKMQTSTDI